MKKRLLIIGLFIGCMLVLGACESSNGGETKALDFDNIKLFENYCTAEDCVTEVTRTETGVHLSKYKAYYGDYDNPEISITDELDGDEEMYNQIAQMAASCKIQSWDGFHESASNVLDGTSFGFEADLADGTEIEASGYNKFPKNYSTFVDYLDGLFENQ